MEEKEYRELLKSGMFFEFYPALSGNYEQDKALWSIEYKELVKFREKYKLENNHSK